MAPSDPSASGSAIDATITLTNAGQHPCLLDPVPTLAVRFTSRALMPLGRDGPGR